MNPGPESSGVPAAPAARADGAPGADPAAKARASAPTWLGVPGAILLYLGGSLLGGGVALVAVATVLRSWIPDGYDFGFARGLGAATLDFAMKVPRIFVLVTTLSTLGVLLFVVIAARASGRPWRERLGLLPGRVPVSEFVPLVLASLGALVIGGLLARGLQLAGLLPAVGIARMEMGQMLLLASPATRVAFVFSFSVLIGLAEEMVFRGYLQRALLVRWRPAIAIAVSSATFALMHGDPSYDVFVFPVGCFLGYLAWRAGSIRPTIGCHVAVNAIAQSGLAMFGLKYVQFGRHVLGSGPGGHADPVRITLIVVAALVASAAALAVAIRRVERYSGATAAA